MATRHDAWVSMVLGLWCQDDRDQSLLLKKAQHCFTTRPVFSGERETGIWLWKHRLEHMALSGPPGPAAALRICPKLYEWLQNASCIRLNDISLR